ncbi:DUF1887 family protein [Deferribacterales bacterium Es71-Z0220]|jgi:hypothetical protein|uniref:Card1-like endonuclease domain-containing protein n=1 Tax=Deferrivibrio essentukiensis TaxID=2880922 RepID=UPI001F62052C|nr:DUF1887 family CARF protein [Deferrivibrio essentukiensis]MCB4204628.1 DUF1887 family protein [Deferrivibrio essentukiensis]
MHLISIYGGIPIQIMAVLKEFEDKIEKHTIIYDRKYEDDKEFKYFKSGITITPLFRKAKLNLLIYDEDMMDTYKDVVAKLKEYSAPSNLLINLSDPNSALGVYLTNELKSQGANFIIYDNVEADYHFIKGESITHHKVTNFLNVEEYVSSLGFYLLEGDNKKDRESRREMVDKLFVDGCKYNKFREKFLDYKDSNIPQLRKMFPEFYEILHKNGYLSSYNSYDQKFINGTVFEEYIANILDDIGFDDVISSTILTYDPYDNDMKNEIDVIAIYKNKLSLAECKMGKNFNAEYLIYKYNSIYNLLNGSNKLLIAFLESNLDKVIKSKNPDRVFKRAELLDVSMFQTKNIDKKRLMSTLKGIFDIS